MPKTPTPEHELDLDGKVLLPSRISLRDGLRIVQAMSRMPYAASYSVPIPVRQTEAPREVTVDDVVAFLDGLAGVLTTHGARCHERDVALDRLNADVAAFRRILGTTP